MMKTAPIFSIIMPAYTAGKTIKEAIESILLQTFKDYELIVINDCSQDNTQEIVERYIQIDKRIYLINNIENQGVAKSRNIALEMSKGRYIAFLDSDDRWLPQKLEKQYQAFSNGYDIVYTAYKRFGKAKETIVYPPADGCYASLLKGNYIGNLTGAYDREILGLELQKNIGHEDYLMWLRLMRRSKKSIGLQDVLAEYRVSSNSVSSNVVKGAYWTWKIYRQELGMGWFCSLRNFFSYSWGALQKR